MLIAYTKYIAEYDIAIQGTKTKITNILQLPPGHKPAEDIVPQEDDQSKKPSPSPSPSPY
jgi:hypothetical protein